MPIDPDSLPRDPAILKQMLVDLTTQLDKTQRLLAQLVEAKSGTRSEQLSADQLPRRNSAAASGVVTRGPGNKAFGGFLGDVLATLQGIFGAGEQIDPAIGLETSGGSHEANKCLNHAEQKVVRAANGRDTKFSVSEPAHPSA